MIFLCTLSFSLTSSLGAGLEKWSESLTNSLAIQIVTENEAERDSQTDAVMRMLEATPGIKGVSVAAQSDVLALLAPWLGDIPIGSGLPLPTLIDVELEDGNALNIEALRERLKATAPNASVDDHQEWMNRIIEFAAVLRIALTGVMFMVILSTIAIVIFGCRTSLATHRESIEIMHLIGAEDSMIARAFMDRYLVHGLLGGVGGVLLAGGLLLLLANIAEDIGQGLISASVPDLSIIGWLILIPLISGTLTMTTAFVTVRRALSKML
ncbi:hypothetical protein GCM10017044_01950 [Kordiimonas sediminis]|uniref:ABC3 transporter permease C-terminal domain-containing protein n=2 Tax=Kordiimonas sediminis TaxID=1735581 RepID=A0A919AJ04_9PROT|nr:hypothetical protein GCM10017044_01950 [Kordiimonas sediminis]